MKIYILQMGGLLESLSGKRHVMSHTAHTERKGCMADYPRMYREICKPGLMSVSPASVKATITELTLETP